MRWLARCLRSQHIHPNQRCLPQQLGFTGALRVLWAQITNVREFIPRQPDPLRDGDSLLFRLRPLVRCFPHSHDYFLPLAAINRTEKSAPVELRTDASPWFTTK